MHLFMYVCMYLSVYLYLYLYIKGSGSEGGTLKNGEQVARGS